MPSPKKEIPTKTLSGPLTEDELHTGCLETVLQDLSGAVPKRPRTRADCVDGSRPCPWVSCKYHLALETKEASLQLTFGDKELEELPETCALDVADRGGASLGQVGDAMNLTRERVRQIEAGALEKLRVLFGRMGIEPCALGRECSGLAEAAERWGVDVGEFAGGQETREAFKRSGLTCESSYFVAQKAASRRRRKGKKSA